MSDEKRKLQKERLTGLFKKSNQFGDYWIGKLSDGTEVMVHSPFERKEGGPDLVLSALIPNDTTSKS